MLYNFRRSIWSSYVPVQRKSWKGAASGSWAPITSRRVKLRVTALLLFFSITAPAAMAADANCRDYTLAPNKRSFAASIYDFVIQQGGAKPGDDLNLKTTKILEMIDAYCPEHPYENLAVAIAQFTADVIQPPPAPKKAVKAQRHTK
jgi:hypothetical protein